MSKILFTAILLLLASNVYSANYTVTDLGTFGGNESYAMDINNSGQIVGAAQDGSGTYYAFVYENSTMTNIGTFSGNSYATGINESGEIAGYSEISSGTSHAFYYGNGVMNDLGTIDGYASYAYAINNMSKLAGRACSSSTNHYAVTYTSEIILDVFGGLDSVAYDVNDAGVAVGTIGFSGSNAQAFYYQNGTQTQLGTLGGSVSYAYGVNEYGLIVGASTIASGDTNAFIYENGTMTGLGTLGGTTSLAYDINDQGQVVGYSYYDGSNTDHAFLYENGTMIDLNSLLPANSGWILEYAFSINEFGDIVGSGISPDGYTRAFILYNEDAVRPVIIPEPLSIILLGLSFFGLLRKKTV